MSRYFVRVSHAEHVRLLSSSDIEVCPEMNQDTAILVGITGTGTFMHDVFWLF